jgi:signal transduction histidine kinase
MFRIAVVKLTVWYLAIVIAISLFFSIAVYNIGTSDIAKGIRLQSERIYSSFPIFESKPVLDPAKDIKAEDHNLFIRLVFFNLIVLFFAGLASYWLAFKTLEPIEEAHEQQKRFTANVSHELRTPLTAIRMESEVGLINNQNDLNELRAIIKSNLEEVDKLESLINNLLKLSKFEVENYQKNFKEVNVNKIIQKAISITQKQADNKKIKINYHPQKLYRTIGDEDSLVQLLKIFLDNAIKFSALQSSINITQSKENNSTVINIKDEGIGINPENLEHIFDRFYQADNARTKTAENSGFGLGLSIAKMIADIHKINIIISSKLKEGTNVRLILNQK